MKKVLFYMLIVLLAFGLIGCSDSGDSESWSNATFEQLDGTWVGSAKETVSLKKFVESTGKEYDNDIENAFGKDAKVTTSASITIIINANAKTVEAQTEVSISFSGKNIPDVWSLYKLGFLQSIDEEEREAIIFDDATYSIIIREVIKGDLDENDIAEMQEDMQINSDGSKLRDSTGELEEDMNEIFVNKKEFIYIKQ